MYNKIECTIISERKLKDREKRTISRELRSIFASFDIDAVFIRRYK